MGRSLIRSAGKVGLDRMARESYLSSRQFSRKFIERTGVNPKTYLRIIRFTKAVNMRNAFPDRDWLRIAMECEFHDYQHLAKDYKEFTGCTPNDFHFMENTSPEKRLGLTAEIYKSRAASTFELY